MASEELDDGRLGRALDVAVQEVVIPDLLVLVEQVVLVGRVLVPDAGSGGQLGALLEPDCLGPSHSPTADGGGTAGRLGRDLLGQRRVLLGEVEEDRDRRRELVSVSLLGSSPRCGPVLSCLRAPVDGYGGGRAGGLDRIPGSEDADEASMPALA